MTKPSATSARPAVSATLLTRMDAYWRAANYLSVGQIYLLDNPLLREPLEPRHVKPRLLGHWGTTPGQNFIYVAPESGDPSARPRHDLRLRPGSRRAGGRGANIYLEGTYSEVYPRHHAGRGGPEEALQAVLVSRAGSRATWRRRRPVRSTKAASWAIRSATRSAPHSTTPT